MKKEEIEALKREAQAEVDADARKAAKSQLQTQMRAVASAERLLAVERIKLADLEARLVEGV